MFIIRAGLLLCVFFAGACQSSPRADTPSSVDAALLDRGRAVYFSQCIACHHTDPKKDGVLGPAVFGSSRALLEARVLSKTYPEGYTPKRATQLMQALPQLKGEISALEAFLNQ